MVTPLLFYVFLVLSIVLWIGCTNRRREALKTVEPVHCIQRMSKGDVRKMDCLYDRFLCPIPVLVAMAAKIYCLKLVNMSVYLDLGPEFCGNLQILALLGYP